MIRRKVRVFFPALFVVTVLGPFGTYEAFDFGRRAMYWFALLSVGAIAYEIAVPSLLYSPRLTRRIPRLGRFLLGVLLGSTLVFCAVVVAERMFRAPIAPTMMPIVFFYVLVVGSIVCFVSFMPHVAGAPADKDVAHINYERVDFFQRYPDLRGVRLHRISMEDHYAKVVSDKSTVSIHATMNDLEQQLTKYPGLRIHRSHWIAIDAVEDVVRKGRSMVVLLKGGTSLPIGGTYENRVMRVISEKAAANEGSGTTRGLRRSA